MSLRLVVAAAAAVVVGYVTGNPYYGFQTFALVYGASGFLDPNKKVLGPRLNDLKSPQASYGAVIPLIYGAPRLAGIFAYASDKREIATTETQGKGGPGVDATTFTYEIDALIILAGNECAGIRRVWSNGKLIWSNANDAADESLLASAQANAWRDMRFYSGADDQLPDPTYEAAVGVGNAPAYRGRATVMIEGLNLGGSGQLPVLTFEVVTVAEMAAKSVVFTDVPSESGIVGQGSSPFNPSGFLVHVGQWDPSYLNATVRVYRMGATTSTLIGSYTHALSQPSAHGQTDVAGMMLGIGRDIYWYEWDELEGGATPYHFQLPIGENFGQAQIRFCLRGDVLIFGSSGTGSKKLYRFSKADGATGFPAAPLATCATRSTYVNALATDGSLVYASESSTAGDIEVLNVATMTHQSAIALPPTTTAQGAAVLVDEIGMLLTLIDSPMPGNVWEWDGAAWSRSFPDVYAGFNLNNAQVGVAGGVVFLMSAEGTAGNVQRVHGFYKTLVQGQVPLADVVTDLCLRGRQLTAADIDVTALAGKFVRAMAVTQISSARTSLELLGGVHLFEWVEADKLRAVLRGGAPVLTIPYTDLGVSDDGNAEPMPKKRANDIEIPAQVTVKYANVLNDFQDGAETSDRLVTESTATSVIEVAMGLTPGEAKKVADANALDLAVSELQVGPLSVSARKYANLEATDVVLVTARDGSTFRLRIVKGTVGGGVLTLEDVLDDASAILSAASTDESYAASSLVRLLAPTAAEYLDIPILRDADNDAGFYVAAKPASASRWPGAAIFSSRDDITHAREETVTERAIFGVCSSTIGNWTGPRVFDEVNAVTVVVGAELSSSTRAALLDDDAINAAAVGVDGRWELLQFRDAALVSPGVYRLTGLLRGSRGTEWAMSGHGAGEKFVLITPAGFRRIEVEGSLLGIDRYYRAVTLGQSLSSASTVAFNDTGVGLKPFSPFDCRAIRDGSGDITLTWQRRTRLAVRTVGLMGISVPLGEATEAYAVDIFTDNTYATVKRTLTSGTTSAVYTNAQQVADFGSGRARVYVKVYQLSAVVGRGYPLKAAA